MTGLALILTFIAAIGLMIVAMSKWNIHPFIAIIGIAIILAIVSGIPIGKIPDTIGKGFSSIFTSIGLVIIFGMLIGLILEKTGAAVKLADSVVKVVGEKHPQLALLIIGWIVSIPVFCDSGFIIVNPIRKSLARRTGASSVALTLALSAGLYASHVFMPPTPGPIAAAGMIGLEGNLLLVLIIGAIVSIPTLTAAHFFAKSTGRRVTSNEDEENSTGQEYEKLINSYGKLPSFGLSIAPIIVPILLMALASIFSMSRGESLLKDFIIFLGKPVFALIIGFLCGVVLLVKSKKGDTLYDICQETLKTAGPIIFITAAGSVLGNVIVEAGLVDYIKENVSALSIVGIFFPFLIAAFLKSSVGSSTVAITTTASMMGYFNSHDSMLYVLGMTTPLEAALVVMAIGAGAMTVSHANDSYFWVVTNFGGLKPQDGYRTQTLMTLVMGLSAILSIFIVSLFL